MKSTTFNFDISPTITFQPIQDQLQSHCYELKPLEQNQRTTLVLSNTRELDKVPSTEQSTLYTSTHGLC